jgi:flagellar biosynthesis protein FliR
MDFLSDLQRLTPLAQPQLIAGALVFARVTGLMLAAPLLSTREMPMRVRALMAIAMTLMVWPLHSTTAIELPESLIDLGVAVGLEMLIGATLGLGVMILFAALQVAGTMIGQLSGLSLGEVFDPNFDDVSHVFSQFLYQVTITVFVLIGGHRLLVGALLDTFKTLPAGAGLPPNLLEALSTLLVQSFDLGIRIAAPVVVSLLLALIVLAIIGRTVPQLNVLVLGFSLNALVAMSILALTLGGGVWAFQDELGTTFEVLSGALTTTRTP